MLKLTVFAVCIACAYLGPAYGQDAANGQNLANELRSLHWVVGPAHVEVGSNATFDIPDGYRYLGPADTVRLMQIMHNLPPDKGSTLFMPDNNQWFALFSYHNSGHISDKQKIDDNAVLNSIKEGQKIANKELSSKGWETIQIIGWKYKPFYDPDNNDLSWAIKAKNSDGAEIINYNTRLLGRTGYTSAVLVADPNTLSGDVTAFKRAIKSYKFNPSQTYQAFKPGDKVSEYGLAALITGGAAAVAVKTGLWKVLLGWLVLGWKFIAAAFVALLASMRKFFMRLLGRDKNT